jgi:pyruvate dehydrogenase E2 component (dihydrolipoamide acetyltransferase)
MATEIILPQLGETMDEGTVVEWLVQEGQPVKRGDPIYKLESDKAVLEVTAPASGVLRKILVPAGTTVPVLTVVGVIAAPDEDISKYLAQAPATAQAIAAPPLEHEAGPSAAPVHEAEPKLISGQAAMAQGRIFASPRARRLARLEDVPLWDILGTGPGGRIVERDVKAYIEGLPPMTPAAKALAQELGLSLRALKLPPGKERLERDDVLEQAGLKKREEAPAVAPAPAPPHAEAAAFEVIPLKGIRGRIAEKMAQSAQTTAAFTLTTEADAAALVAWRESLRRTAGQGGRVPTYNDLLIRLLTCALKEHPALNARLEDGEIRRYQQINLGVAVDTERGLLVPVLRNAGQLTLAEIAERTAQLIERARSGQLGPDEMSGGTFTITNLGMFETDAFTPIINIPEVAILGVGRIRERVVAREGQICVRPTVVLSLTVDHRAVDGAPAARFLQRLKQLIEEPLLAL